jgi:hypothetical protein
MPSAREETTGATEGENLPPSAEAEDVSGEQFGNMESAGSPTDNQSEESLAGGPSDTSEGEALSGATSGSEQDGRSR